MRGGGGDGGRSGFCEEVGGVWRMREEKGGGWSCGEYIGMRRICEEDEEIVADRKGRGEDRNMIDLKI